MQTFITSLTFIGIILFYLLIIFGAYFAINRWITKIIAVRKEQNELLKEAIKLLDKISNR